MRIIDTNDYLRSLIARPKDFYGQQRDHPLNVSSGSEDCEKNQAKIQKPIFI